MTTRKAIEMELEYEKMKQAGLVKESIELLNGSKVHLAHNLSAKAVALGEVQVRIDLLEAVLRLKEFA